MTHPTLAPDAPTSPALATYLNDHLAGSVMALRLLESLEASFAEHERTRTLAPAVQTLRREIEADRDVLAQLIAQVGSDESTLRKTAGWFAERFAQAKLALDGGTTEAFRVLEMAEVIALGIRGKQGLWRALQVNADRLPAVRTLDLDVLIGRADAQFARMEVLRLGAARAAFTDERHATGG